MALCDTEGSLMALQTQPNRQNLNLVEPTAMAFAINTEVLANEMSTCCGISCIPKVEYAANAAYVRLYPNRIEWNDPAVSCVPRTNVIPPARFACCNFYTHYVDRINVIHFDQPLSNIAAEPGCCEKCAYFGCIGCCCPTRNAYVGANPPFDCFECLCGYCRCPGCNCCCYDRCCAFCETSVTRGAQVHGNPLQGNLPFILLPELKEHKKFIDAYNNVHATFRTQFPMIEVKMVR